MIGFDKICFVSFTFWSYTLVSGQNVPLTHTMSIGLARQILTLTLDAKGITKRPAFDLEYYDGKDSRFYFFEATWDTPSTSVATGHAAYAVNRVTGDIWEPFGCDSISSPPAERLKLRIRKWMKLTRDEYESAKGYAPCP